MFDNIKSNKILKDIFLFLKKRKKLKIIKINKKLMNRLNIQTEDFQDILLLKEIKNKFNLNIKDINIKKLDVGPSYLENEILEYFNKIEFDELKEINLYIFSEISDILKLERAGLDKLEILIIKNWSISDINPLEKVNFKNLKKLDLGWNKISDINVLEKVKFKELNKLSLDNNKIDKQNNNSIIINMRKKIKNLNINL